VQDLWDKIELLTDPDVLVSKYVFFKEDAVAESVLYGYPDYKTRTVVCCSTQSGCPVGCRFCGAGDHFVRSLTANEIISQPKHLFDQIKLDPNDMDKCQIMFMSMGEPLLNFKNLDEACRFLYAMYPTARLLISTIGPKIDYKPLMKLSKEVETIGLQFSVHESTDEARNKLIPFKAKLNLHEISQMGVIWHRETQRRPFFNYCARPDNTSWEDAHRIYELFDPNIWEATISVVCERDETMKTAHDRQKGLAADFQDKLNGRGFSTRMFDPAGQDSIGGGCGQLRYVQRWFADNPLARPSIGYSLPVIHSET